MDEATLELIRQGFRDRDDEVIGYRRITERTSEAPCPDGCFAPGSSPHWHTRLVAWEFVGRHAILTVNAAGESTRDSMLWPIESFMEMEELGERT